MQGARLGQFELLDKVGEGGMGIITIYDIAEESGCTAFVMGYVNGQPLDTLIPPKGMRLTEGLGIAVQAADAPAAAHAANIVHRERIWVRTAKCGLSSASSDQFRK